MNEVADERLMTIADLSMMRGVPIDTLYGCPPQCIFAGFNSHRTTS
jgi:hypothetical protein